MALTRRCLAWNIVNSTVMMRRLMSGRPCAADELIASQAGATVGRCAVSLRAERTRNAKSLSRLQCQRAAGLNLPLIDDVQAMERGLR